MIATVRVIWLCACVRSWTYRGVGRCASLLSIGIVSKKVVSDSPGLVDFAIGLVIFVLNLPDGKVLCFGEIQITEEL